MDTGVVHSDVDGREAGEQGDEAMRERALTAWVVLTDAEREWLRRLLEIVGHNVDHGRGLPACSQLALTVVVAQGSRVSSGIEELLDLRFEQGFRRGRLAQLREAGERQPSAGS